MREPESRRDRTVFSQVKEERLDRLQEYVGGALFTKPDAMKALGITDKAAGELNRYGVRTRRIKLVATAHALQQIEAPQPCFDTFSFDFTKTEDDAFAPFDPIPKEERTLDLQLIDDALLRYYEVRNYLFNGRKPTRPTDRPLDQWEQVVFKERKDVR